MEEVFCINCRFHKAYQSAATPTGVVKNVVLEIPDFNVCTQQTGFKITPKSAIFPEQKEEIIVERYCTDVNANNDCKDFEDRGDFAHVDYSKW